MDAPEQPDGMELEPVNEYLLDEYVRVKNLLKDLGRCHEITVNRLVEMSLRNDQMQAAGDAMHDLLRILWTFPGVDDTPVKNALQRWEELNG